MPGIVAASYFLSARDLFIPLELCRYGKHRVVDGEDVRNTFRCQIKGGLISKECFY